MSEPRPSPTTATPDPSPDERVKARLRERIDAAMARPLEEAVPLAEEALTAARAEYHLAEQAKRFQSPPRTAPDLGGAINRLIQVDATARRQAEQRLRAEVAATALVAEVEPKRRQILDALEVQQAGPPGAELARLESLNTNELRAQVRQELWHTVDRLERLRRDCRSSLTNSIITLTRIPARIAALSVRDLTSTERFPMSLADAIRADVDAQAGVPHAVEEGLAEAARLIEDLTKEIVSGPRPQYTKLAPEMPEPTEHPMPVQTVR